MNAETQATKQYRYYSYDVWGNADDGYDVNNVFRTADVIAIPDGLDSDAALFEHLRSIGFLTGKNLDVALFSTIGDYCDSTTIYMEYDSKPAGELRLEETAKA